MVTMAMHGFARKRMKIFLIDLMGSVATPKLYDIRIIFDHFGFEKSHFRIFLTFFKSQLLRTVIFLKYFLKPINHRPHLSHHQTTEPGWYIQ
jgi:hypothetical protein